MAFDPQTFLKDYTKKIDTQTQTKTSGGFNPEDFLKTLPKVPQSKSRKFDNSQSLYNLAVQSGLQKDADEILAQKGEETKKIFSGGMISDIFDAMNVLQYGVTGVLKGKGFKEGIETRQSFADKDALGDNGLPGTIAGIVLDILVDPLTYVAPWTIAKKIPGLAKAAKVSQLAFEGSKVGQWLGKKFVYMFGQDPVFRETIERAEKNIVVGDMNIKKLVEGIVSIPKEKAGLLLSKDSTGRFIRTDLEKLKGVLDEDELFKVARGYSVLDDLGKQAVDLGLLNRGKWEENVGEYIKNTYEKYEKSKSKGLFGFVRQKVAGIKKRKDLTPEEMAKLGQIDNPAYLFLRSMVDLSHDIENTKMFNVVAKQFGSDVAKEGFEKLPEGIARGALSGKYVPKNIFDYLTEIQQSKSNIEKGWNKVIGEFKFNKVILNPATHARNILSNRILNWWKLGLGPWRVDIDAEVIKQMTKGGKYIDEAKSVGYGMDTFAANELRNNLLSEKGGLLGKISNLRNKLSDFYQGEENYAKLSAFIFNRKKGISIEEAWKAAESATFNYAQVSPFVRRLRESIWGYPFITFTAKATPVAIETALKYPRRISSIGKIKQAIEQQADIKETEQERKNEPAWVRNGFFVKLPMKDEKGRSAYFDLTYIIPFGDLVSGQFLEPQIKRETGLPESKAETLISKAPLINLIKEISRNQDFYGDKIWQESDSQEKRLGDLFRHITKTFVPPLVSDQLPGGYITKGKQKGERRQKGVVGGVGASEENQQRTLMEELLRQVGMKIQPVNGDLQETFMEFEKKKALETLLREKGDLTGFEINYIPKKK